MYLKAVEYGGGGGGRAGGMERGARWEETERDKVVEEEEGWNRVKLEVNCVCQGHGGPGYR